MSRSHKKRYFASSRDSHYPKKSKAGRALKRRTRTLVTTQYESDDLVLPSRKEYSLNRRVWYNDYESWCQRRTPQSIKVGGRFGLMRTCWPVDYYLYYLEILRK